MKGRKKMSRKASRKYFSKTGATHHKMNSRTPNPLTMRGGIRLS